ncbi:helix-turn-helix domain-containing protein [Bacteroides fragilis]
MAILNNIKNVLSEKGVMSKWLAKQLQKDPATVSKWCNNHSQPDLYTFVRIANLLMLMFMNLFVIQKNSI